MAQRKQSNQEPVNDTKFGWCMDKLHDACIVSFFSEQTSRDYNCGCDCHKEK